MLASLMFCPHLFFSCLFSCPSCPFPLACLSSCLLDTDASLPLSQSPPPSLSCFLSLKLLLPEVKGMETKGTCLSFSSCAILTLEEEKEI